MVNNGVITAPISVKDPYTCMGVGATANGYDLGYICANAHKKINIWSKKKPMSYSKLPELTDAEMLSVNYGLSVTYGRPCVYAYNPPTGGDASPFRLTDFVGYNHAAKTGLDFEQESYSVDLIENSDGLTVRMVQDAAAIKLTDLYKLFAGCKVRLGIRDYGGTTNYRYYSAYADVTATVPTTWTVPFGELMKFNVGKRAIWVECLTSSGGTIWVMPSSHRYLYITAEVGASFTNPLDDETIVSNGVERKALIYYRSGGYSYYVDLNNNRNLMFDLGGLKNDTGVTLSASNVRMRFDYLDANNVQKITYVPVYIGTNTKWSAPTGTTGGGGYFTAFGTDIPSFGGKRNVYVGLYVYLLKNGSYKYLSISDTVNIRLEKS